MMNCETIDSILDERRSTRLSPAERQDVAVHLERCESCAGGWAANDALARDRIAEPAPELFARVLAQLDAARARSGATYRRRRAAAAAAAVLAAVAVVAGYSAFDFGAAPDGASAATPVSATPMSAPRFVAGRDYEVLVAATPLAATADGVPVTEFFMYHCFACYSIEEDLESFRTAAVGRVALIRVPAVFDEITELHARAFYTAEALGKLDALHAALYDEVHVRSNRLASRAELAELFARFGVDAATFATAFDSSAVDARVQRALELAAEYGISAVPSIVVAGRYSTNPTLAGSSLFAVVGELVDAAAPCQTRCDGLRQPQAYDEPLDQPR